MSGHRRRRQDAEDEDEEEILQFGERRSRREVSWEYRDSSSLSPIERMEQAMHYRVAANMMNFTTQLLLLIASLFARIRIYNVLIDSWSVCGDVMSSFIAHGRDVINRWEDTIPRLQYLLRHCRYCSELALLYADDLSIFVRSRRHRFQPEKNRTMEEINRRDCYTWFGISPDALRMLHLHWRIPERLQSPRSRHRFDGEACFLICLFHMVKGTTWIDMSQQYFGGNPRYFSWMHDAMIDHLYNTFYHKISGGSLEQWIPQYVDQCRQLIHAKLTNGVIQEEHYVNGQLVNSEWIRLNFDIRRFRVVGFLDDLALETATPGIGARRREDFDHDIQRAFYSGYFRKHGLKAQVVYLPIGIIASVFITEIRQNDNGVQNFSGLNNYLVELLRGSLIGNLFPALYADGIFASLATILPRFRNPNDEQRLLNILRLASMRQVIEHVFGQHRNKFRVFDSPQYLQLFNKGQKMRKMFMVSFFMMNCFNCINGGACQ